MGKCFVIQPFDNAAFDKRYDDVFAPAIRQAGLEPYRVDRDPTVTILIESIEAEIRDSDACLADITTDNPNVWYELGYAYARGKDVVLTCATQREKFPFDVQHRNIIRYAPESPRDFTDLGNQTTSRLKAMVTKQERLKVASSLSPVEETEGLSPHEIAVLVVIMENRWSPDSSLSPWQIVNEVKNAGFTAIAATLGLESLVRKKMIEMRDRLDPDNEPYTAYAITGQGAGWLLNNQDRLVLRAEPDDLPYAEPDDLPF